MTDVARRSSAATPYDLWQRGVTLAHAVAEVSVPDDQSRSDAARVRRGFERLRTDPRSPLHDRVDTLQRLQGLAGAWEDEARRVQDARHALATRLAAGHVVALGFVVDPSGGLRLAAVPPAAWIAADAQDRIDWERSRVDALESRFEDVRIVFRPTPPSGPQDLLE